jgi:hypothetical protein
MTPIGMLKSRIVASHFANVHWCAELGFHRCDPASSASYIYRTWGPIGFELLNLSPGLAQYMTKVVGWGPTAFGRSCPLELVAELAPKLMAVMDLTVCGDLVGRSSPWDGDFDDSLNSSILQFQNAIMPVLQAPTLATLSIQSFPFITKQQLHQFICIPPLVTLILNGVYLSPKSDWTSGTDLHHGDTTQQCLTISGLGLNSQDAPLARWLLVPHCPVNIASLREF